LQVGFEVFDRADPAGADAEVFALIARVLAPLSLRAATGDMGLLIAAVEGLSTTPRRKAALLRHIWRPRRFRALLDRFAGRVPVPPSRAALLGRLSVDDAAALIAQAGPMIGLRGEDEIAARAAALVEDSAAPPIAEGEAAALDALLRIEGRLAGALAPLRAVASRLPALDAAVDRFAARVQALADRGVDPGAVDFAASHGRTTLEYYDGFVFSFHGPGDMPPVASGGRYDALTAVLGQGRSIPAVGGVVRPALVAGLRGAGA
ncbi:MAG TPA: ATP phosphoribosyltransferase regulatory subunit, partial [Paracoccaceae bacterium]|nr:ATP phosphoribosyltransferase regulatory subunit [Paracoccaceae bacterium]